MLRVSVRRSIQIIRTISPLLFIYLFCRACLDDGYLSAAMPLAVGAGACFLVAATVVIVCKVLIRSERVRESCCALLCACVVGVPCTSSSAC